MIMKTQPIEIYAMPQKQFLEGRKSTAIQVFLIKEEKSQINNLTYHRKELEKEEQTKPSQWKEGNHKNQKRK